MVKQPEKEIVKELSEDEFGLKLNCCFADTALKIASGAATGTLFSIVFSKAKKTWPIWLGAGIGIGMGWSNCKHVLRNPPNWRFSKKWGNDCTNSSSFFNSSTTFSIASVDSLDLLNNSGKKEESSDQTKKETKP